MGRLNTTLQGFNTGQLSLEALSRVDMERVRFGAEEMTNFLPRVLGSMRVRPGLGYLGSTASDAACQLIPFVYNAEDKALIELTNELMRVWVDDELITRPNVTTTVTNGTFATDLTGWTDNDDSGAASSWASGAMVLLGTGTNYAKRYQQVTVSGGNVGVVHALRVVVERGPVLFRVGSSSTNDNYVAETELKTGTHSLAFTPTGDFYITVYANASVQRLVASITLESSGVLTLPTPWTSAMLGRVRYDQSGDVIFCAYPTVCQRRIERRDNDSWSIVEYRPNDGPFRGPNLARLTLTPSAVTGNITLTASQRLFRTSHVGALFQLTHNGQTAAGSLAAADTATTSIRITGVERGGGRDFTVEITGTFTATVTLQRAFGEEANWTDVTTYTGPTSTLFNTDDYNNEIVYYRLSIKSGDYTSGTAVCQLLYSNSSQTGVVRVTEYTSSTEVNAEVLSTLGKDEATSDWREGTWSDRRGYPASVALHDGRLFWGASDTIYGSVSDAYESFDQDLEGDSGPIVRSVSTGPADGLYWLLSLLRLFCGGPSQEVSIRSSSFDEPLTPTQFTAKATSTKGSANIAAVAVDGGAIFVQRDGRRVFELVFDGTAQEFVSNDLTRLNPGICDAGVVEMAVQRQPDTRIWCVLADGTAAVLTYERNEEVVGWSTVETDGDIERVCVLPGSDEDEVYFCVKRTIDGSTVRYIEKLAKERDCQGGTLNRIADSYITYSGSATATITGLDHLEGEDVVVWADGLSRYDQTAMLTVSGGQITLANARSNVVVGLPYTARYKSMKLAFAAEMGTALLQRKVVNALGFILLNTTWLGVRAGRDFNNLRRLPKVIRGAEVTQTDLLDYFDFDMTTFNGAWDTDARVCLEVKAPYPATVAAMVVGLVTNDMGMPSAQPPQG